MIQATHFPFLIPFSVSRTGLEGPSSQSAAHCPNPFHSPATPKLQLLPSGSFYSCPTPSSSSSLSVNSHQPTTQQLVPSPCFNFPDPSQIVRSWMRGMATSQPCPAAKWLQCDVLVRWARATRCSSGSPCLVTGGTPTQGIFAGAICSTPTASGWPFFLLRRRNLLRFVGSMANQRSTIHSMFPTACKIMEVYFPLTAREWAWGSWLLEAPRAFRNTSLRAALKSHFAVLNDLETR